MDPQQQRMVFRLNLRVLQFDFLDDLSELCHPILVGLVLYFHLFVCGGEKICGVFYLLFV
jgi:hypothetical protein